MTVAIIPNVFGIFAFSENGEIFSERLFTSKEEIPDRLYSLQMNIIIPELESLLYELKEQNVNNIIVEDNELAQVIKSQFEFNIQVQKPSSTGKEIRENLFELGIKLNLFESIEEFKEYIQDINIKITRKKVAKASERRDKLIIQAIESVDDLDKSLNIFASRMREWYGLHFPELNKLVSNHTTFLKLISEIGLRNNYDNIILEKVMGYSEEKAQKLANLAEKSMGSQIQDFDLLPLQQFAANIINLYKIRDDLAKYIDEAMSEVAPNLRAIVGSTLGARLISAAGGLMELAQKPSSTVQVLGAERALFRSLKTGAKPPKHGIIFQWEPIYNAKWWLRGKIARAVASKLSIAVRVDAFSGEYIADDLLEHLNFIIKELSQKYPEPPKKKKVEKEKKIKREMKKEKPYGKKKKQGDRKKKKYETKRKDLDGTKKKSFNKGERGI